MRNLGKISVMILVLLTAGLMLSGCGRRGALERLKAAQTETVTVELQPGSNFIVIAAGDDKGLMTRESFFVFRAETGEELAKAAAAPSEAR